MSHNLFNLIFYFYVFIYLFFYLIIDLSISYANFILLSVFFLIQPSISQKYPDDPFKWNLGRFFPTEGGLD